MKREVNEKIQKSSGDNTEIPSKQENETYSANVAIQNRFYEENEKVEDDIDTSLSMNSNIGAVLLPEDEEE